MKCDYINCEEEAITEGFVLTRGSEGERYSPVNVNACNKHKEKSAFFEKVEEEKMEMYTEIIILNKNNAVIETVEVENNCMPTWERIEEVLKKYKGAFKAKVEQSYRMKKNG